MEHVARVEGLPFHHADPFDRLLVAQALCNDLTLVTADMILEAYGRSCRRADNLPEVDPPPCGASQVYSNTMLSR